MLKTHKKNWGASLALTFFVLLGGCADTAYQTLEKTPTVGTPFSQALARHYQAMLEMEEGLVVYKTTQELFAEKGIIAAAGSEPEPESILHHWDVKPSSIHDLASAREILMQVLANRGPTEAPEITAKLQVNYDCWLAGEADMWDLDLTKQCRDSFIAGIYELAEAFPPKDLEEYLEVQEKVDLQAAEEGLEQKHMVFFDYDSTALSVEAKQFIRETCDVILEAGVDKVLVLGYADNTGRENYNYKISQKRADVVKAEMVKNGVPAHTITAAGEGRHHFLIPTAFGVKKRENRRAVIQFE